jgi:hypothetical protein
MPFRGLSLNVAYYLFVPVSEQSTMCEAAYHLLGRN